LETERVRPRRSDPSAPGISRVGHGRGFSYKNPDGNRLTDSGTLDRIAALVIPPAWKDVWICTDPGGHLQATGIDDAGRKQYLYHPAWRELRDRSKFHAMERFAEVLPRLRSRARRALEADGEPTRERVSACAVRLLDVGLFRVGGEEYADSSGALGLATLTPAHLSLRNHEAVFDYPGKSGVHHLQKVTDPLSIELLSQLRRRRSGPEELLAFRDGRQWHRLGSDGINDYIQTAIGLEFSAKDFRTWNATVLAAASLAANDEPLDRPHARERVVGQMLREVAEVLGNTPAVARRAYVDPRVLDRYLSGVTIDIGSRSTNTFDKPDGRGRRRLELAVLDLLR
jgi:DNA topoisomerase-1